MEIFFERGGNRHGIERPHQRILLSHFAASSGHVTPFLALWNSSQSGGHETQENSAVLLRGSAFPWDHAGPSQPQRLRAHLLQHYGRSSRRGAVGTNPTRKHEDLALIPGLAQAQRVKDPALP